MNYSRVLFLLIFWIVAACSQSNKTPTDQEVPLASAEEYKANPERVTEVPITTLSIGSKAPEFRLPASDGNFYSLSDFADAAVLAIIFTCNHCPTAQAYEDRIISLTENYADQGVSVVAISPNSPLALLYGECGYSDLGDSFEDMKLRAEYKQFNFPYLYDGDNHSVSIKYGPQATPHAFVFDQNRILRYQGRIDNSEKPGTAESEDIKAAIDAILADQEIETPETKTFGCSIKWAWKDDWKTQMYKKWEDAPVTLEEIDEQSVAELLANQTEKLRLINVWATWCGPCIMEYPEFLIIHRMYRGRDFEFISISADKLDKKDDALRFLQKQNSAVKNYIFASDDKYKLIDAIDTQWNGALPYTLLIEPGGNRIYSEQGTIKPLSLKRLIVEHPMIGRYY